MSGWGAAQLCADFISPIPHRQEKGHEMSSKDEKTLARPALVTLRNDERVNLAITERAPSRAAGGSDGGLMPAAW